MGLNEGLFLTWILLLIPVFLYGIWDIWWHRYEMEPKESRWLALGLWLFVGFIGGLYLLWR